MDSAASGAACGLEGIRAGRRYAFFLNGDGSPWSANLCGGTGFGVGPERLERVVASDDAATSVGRVPEPGGPDRLPVSGFSYAGIGVGALAATMGAAVAWRRRRSSGAA